MRHDWYQSVGRVLAVVTLAALSPTLTSCGPDDRTDLGDMEDSLSALERRLEKAVGVEKQTACVGYADVCERAVGVCLWIDEESLLRRCEAMTNRCETNLSKYCGRPGPTPDGGDEDAGSYDSDAGTGDASSYDSDAEASDSSSSDAGWSDSGWSDSGWPDSSWPDAGWPDAAVSDTQYRWPDAEI